MRLKFTRIVSMILLLCMLLSNISPLFAYAQTTEDQTVIAETESENSHSSTASAPAGYTPKNTLVTQQVLLSDGASEQAESSPKVLLIEDVLPWDSTANQVVLGALTEYDKVTTNEFLNVELENYGVVVFANDQPFDTYENYTAFKEYLEVFASIGGVIVFGACDSGWSGGSLNAALPGDVTKTANNQTYNYVAKSDHAIVTGELTDGVALTDAALVSNYCSHISFNEETLPAGSVIILRESSTNKPTLVEYPLGKGRVIASGLTWEHNYVHEGESGGGVTFGNFADTALDDLYKYAIRVSSIDRDELQQLEEWRYNKNAHSIVVADASGNINNLTPIQGANVNIDGENFTTDQNGQVLYRQYGIRDILITAEGYREFKSVYNMEESSGRIFLMEKAKNDGLPYIIQATATIFNGDSVDLRYQTLRFTEGSSEYMAIYFDGNWMGSKPGQFVIYQDATADYPGFCLNVPHGNYRQFAPGKTFNPNSTIWVKMVSPDGKESEPVKLNLYVDPKPFSDTGSGDNAIDEGPGSFRWIQNQKLAPDNELINKVMKMDASITSELIPYEVAVEVDPDDGSRTYKLVIGLLSGDEITNILYSKTDAHSFKGQDPWKEFTKMYKDYAKNGNIDGYVENLSNKFSKSFHPTRLRSFLEGDVSLNGYYTYTVDKDGRYIVTPSGGVMGKGDAKLVVGKTVLFYGVPVFFEFNFGTNLELMIDLLNSNGLTVDFNNLQINLPYATLEGGVGVRNVATVGVGGQFNHNVILNKQDAGGYMTTNAFVHVEIMFILEETVKFGKSGAFGKWGTYAEAKDAANSVTATLQSAQENKSLVSRNYLEHTSEWFGTPVNLLSEEDALAPLQTGVMTNAMPRIHQVGDKTVMLFLRDAADRATGNHTQLVYSVLENGTWSEPAAVCESDTADFFFSSVANGNQLYVAWQKSTVCANSEDPEVLLASVAQGSEICTAVWDSETGVFSEAVYLTEDTKLDMMASICANGNESAVIWVSNDQNSIINPTGTYSINSVIFDNGVPGSTAVMCSTEEYITELSSGITESGLQVIYSTADEENETRIYHIRNGIAVPVMANGSYANLSFENGQFLWQGDGVLYSYDPETGDCTELIAREDTAVSSSYRYVENGNNDTLVWFDASDRSLLASVCCDGTWQAPVVLLNNIADSITFMDVTMTDGGQFAVVANTAAYTEDGELSNSAIAYTQVTPGNDTELVYTYAGQPDWTANTQEISLELKNNGFYPVNQVDVTVASGSVSYLNKTVDVELAPGESYYFTESLDISSVSALTEATVSVLPVSDSDSSNNTAQITLGYSDVALALDAYEQNDSILFALTVSNHSPIASDVAISIKEDNLDGIVLDVKNLGTITSEECIQYLYALDKTKIDFGENTVKNYIFALDSLTNDWNDSDNVCHFSVSRPVVTEVNPDGEMIEVEIIDPTSITIQSEDIVFSGPDAESIQLQAQVAPENASVTYVEWSVENGNIVHITSDGTVTPLRAGRTTITATVMEGISDTISVTVLDSSHDHSYTAEVTAPTCTKQGFTTYTCACGDTYVDEHTEATGHSWDEGVVTKEPTESEDGECIYVCTICKETRTEVLPKVEHIHNHTAVVTDPTCTEQGFTTYTCECGDTYVDDYVDAHGHNVVVKESEPASCELNGFEYHACEYCGGQEHTIILEAIGHSYVDGECEHCGEADPNAKPSKPGWGSFWNWIFGGWWGDNEEEEKCEHAYTSAVTDPTCTDKGYTTHTCEKCGDSFKDSYVDATGHRYVDNICEHCGAKKSSGSWFDWIFRWFW